MSVQLIVPSLSLRTKSFVVLRIFCTVPKVTLISVVKKVSRALDSLIFQISVLLRQKIPVRLRGLSQVSRKFASLESLCTIVVTKQKCYILLQLSIFYNLLVTLISISTNLLMWFYKPKYLIYMYQYYLNSLLNLISTLCYQL